MHSFANFERISVKKILYDKQQIILITFSAFQPSAFKVVLTLIISVYFVLFPLNFENISPFLRFVKGHG